jgi:hypothetical protein
VVPSKHGAFRSPGPKLDLGDGGTRAAEAIPAHPDVLWGLQLAQCTVGPKFFAEGILEINLLSDKKH